MSISQPHEAMPPVTSQAARDSEGFRMVLAGLGKLGYRDDQIGVLAMNLIGRADQQFAERRHTAALERIGDSVSPIAAMALQVTRTVVRQIETEFGLLTAEEVATLLGSKTKHPRSFTSDLRQAGKVMHLPRLNTSVYPGFQFDADRGRVRPFVTALIALAFDAEVSVEDVPLWMMTATTFLRGARPVDHLDEPELIVEVARRAWNPGW